MCIANVQVGECRSLIFGVSLTDYDFARGEGSDHGRPPTIVEKCISAIDEKGTLIVLLLRTELTRRPRCRGDLPHQWKACRRAEGELGSASLAT